MIVKDKGYSFGKRRGFMQNEIILLFRMLLAVLCGALIGLERSRRQKEAGIRTHIMVTLGSALIVIVSKYGFLDVAGAPGINVDVSRMAANIITGVSFLGAGVIFLRGGYVKGLTTAAGIWATAGVGCAIGAGMYVVGISATVAMIVIQIILHCSLPNPENMPVAELSFRTQYNVGVVSVIKECMNGLNIKILKLSMKKKKDNTMIIALTVRIPNNLTPDKILDEVSKKCVISDFSAQI